jgi:hypothetical protein
VPVSAEEYWTSYDLGTATSIDEVVDLARTATADKDYWVWRGQPNASWGLHSTLSRVIHLDIGAWPDEEQLAARERVIFDNARSWGLNWSTRGRLSALELLALIRHHGAPSRFIDASLNALVAVHNACLSTGGDDGRVFVLDGRGHVSEPDLASLETGPLQQTPSWWGISPAWWLTDYAVWLPPPIDDRITRQQGAFLIGGAPTTAANPKWYLRGLGPGNWLSQGEVRAATSIGARCHTEPGGPGASPQRPVRTFRIAAAAKAAIDESLSRLFGLSPRTLYPDAGGFTTFGLPTN